MKLNFFVAAMLSILMAPLAAQTEDAARLTLDDLSAFRERGIGDAQWVDGGGAYTTIEPSEGAEGGRDLVRCETGSGRRTVLVPAERLVPEGRDRPLHIAEYEWSPDGSVLLIFTNTERVWRHHTRGDYWVLDVKTWTLRKLGGEAAPSSLMFAKFAPEGRRVGYVRDNDLYVEDLETGAIARLTADGSETVSNGTTDWVYEEEFALRDAFRFSPDGCWIAYWRIDAGGVGVFNLIDNTSETYPRLKPIRYPKAGTTNPACRVGIVSASGGETRWLDVPGDPRDNYIPRLEWAAGSDEVALQQLNRLQNTNRVMLIRRETGEARVLLADTDEAWVDVCDEWQWIAGGERLLFVSERDGWRHAYEAARPDGALRCITPGDFDVLEIRHVDEEGGWLYFIASPDNAAQRFLYRALLAGGGRPERITPKGSRGIHSYQISPGGKWAFHTASSFGEPAVADLVRLPSHETVRVLEDNGALRQKMAAVARGESFFFKVEIAEGIVLDGWCIQPPDFDPAKKYPVLFHVYGEPAGQTVLDEWGGLYYLWHLMLAQRGYVVMSVDNRGTPAPRGREWRKCVYRKVGLLPSQDQAAAVEAIIRERPWVDPDRIGIWGWSGGGSMSLNAIFRYPKLYRTAMAVATVPDQRLYDTIYIERYMGLPQDDPEVYRLGSPITFAHQLEGNLLVVHGTADDNCHYQGFEKLVNELIEHNKHFTAMPYPGRSHSIHEGENTLRHLFGLLTRYLEDNLPAGPR